MAQQYLPGSLQGQVFYQPSDQGQERQAQQQVARQREAQLAAMVEGFGLASPEALTFGPTDAGTDRWLQRSLSQTGLRLAQIRDRLFELANLQRHQLVLDLNAGSGLLTWEALRQVPEGGVYACVSNSKDAAALQEQIALLPELSRPLLLQTTLQDLPQRLAEPSGIRFDCIVGRNALAAQPDKVTLLHQWLNLLHPQGQLLLAETILQQTQRLYQFLDADALGNKLYKRLVNAEEAVYADPMNVMVNWNLSDLEKASQPHRVKLYSQPMQTEMTLTSAALERWFSPGKDRPSYSDRLGTTLNATELKTVQDAFSRLKNQVVQWQSVVGYIQVWPDRL